VVVPVQPAPAASSGKDNTAVVVVGGLALAAIVAFLWI
jgi:hypothetical protein